MLVAHDGQADAPHHRLMPLDQRRERQFCHLVCVGRESFQELAVCQVPDRPDIVERSELTNNRPVRSFESHRICPQPSGRSIWSTLRQSLHYINVTTNLDSSGFSGQFEIQGERRLESRLTSGTYDTMSFLIADGARARVANSLDSLTGDATRICSKDLVSMLAGPRTRPLVLSSCSQCSFTRRLSRRPLLSSKPPNRAELTAAQRSKNVESFEVVWKTIRDKHFDPKLGGLDWQAVHDASRPKVEAATTMKDARARISEAIDRLHQTHFGIIPAELYEGLENPNEGSGRGRARSSTH